MNGSFGGRVGAFRREKEKERRRGEKALDPFLRLLLLLLFSSEKMYEYYFSYVSFEFLLATALVVIAG